MNKFNSIDLIECVSIVNLFILCFILKDKNKFSAENNGKSDGVISMGHETWWNSKMHPK